MSERFELSDALRHNIAAMYSDGEPWLESIDGLVATLESRWSIECHGVHRSSMSFVTNADRNNEPFAVLKLMPPESEYFIKEHAAHEVFADSIAPMLESDVELGAMLISRVLPGDTLSPLAVKDDVAATDALVKCVQRMWRDPGEHRFPRVADLLHDFADYDRVAGAPELPAKLVEKARQMFAYLVDTQTDQVLLHGDLHHVNVLNNRDGWTVIDPQGLIGEREYDLAAAMRNPFEPLETATDLVGLARRRASQYGDALGLNKERILQWTFAQTVLSLCWQVTDNRELVPAWLRYANALATLY